jgi:hypothetical protein
MFISEVRNHFDVKDAFLYTETNFPHSVKCGDYMPLKEIVAIHAWCDENVGYHSYVAAPRCFYFADASIAIQVKLAFT